MKKTLLTRLKPEYTNRLNTMTQPGQEIVIDMLLSHTYWIELTMGDAMNLMIYFELKSINELIFIFD